jgi:hypothetical protein
MQETVVVSQWPTVIGMLAVTLVMAFVNYLIARNNNKHQLKRLSKTLVVNCAIESYKAHMELAKHVAPKGAKKITVDPVANYLLRLSAIVGTLEGDTLTDDDVRQAITKIRQINKVIKEEKGTKKKATTRIEIE